MVTLLRCAAILAACTILAAPAQASDDPGVCSVGLNVGRIRLPKLEISGEEKLLQELNATGWTKGEIHDSSDELYQSISFSCLLSGDKGWNVHLGMLKGIAVKKNVLATIPDAPGMAGAIDIEIRGENYLAGLGYQWLPTSSTTIEVILGREFWRFDGYARVAISGYPPLYETSIFENDAFWYAQATVGLKINDRFSVSSYYRMNGAESIGVSIDYKFGN